MADYKDYGYPDDQPPHTIHYLYPPLSDILSRYKPGVILDVGCGNGAIAGCLLKDGFNIFGVDASQSGIEIARRKYGDDRFFKIDITDQYLPAELQSKQFDAIISTEVIEHIYSPVQYIDFCKKILNANRGMLIISTPYHGYLKNLALALSGRLDIHFSALWEGGHIKFFSRKTITKILEDNGFKVIEFHGAGRFPFFWKSMVVVGVLKD